MVVIEYVELESDRLSFCIQLQRASTSPVGNAGLSSPLRDMESVLYPPCPGFPLLHAPKFKKLCTNSSTARTASPVLFKNGEL